VLVLSTLALVWALLLWSIPAQNFPLGDDWAFSRGVFWWAQGKGIHYSNWAAMPQLGQWIWALPFVFALGPSHVGLRLSTVLLAWLGLWSFYLLLCRGGMTPGRAAFATATLAFNPLFFLLGGTFMTDVPALSFALVALNGYCLALARKNIALFAGATLVAVLAALTRQSAVTAALTGAVPLARCPDLRRQVPWWVLVSVPIFAGVAGHFWLQSRTDISPYQPPWIGVELCFRQTFAMWHWAGLSAIPILLFRPNVGRQEWFAGALMLMLCGMGYCWYVDNKYFDKLFPYTAGLFDTCGVFVSKMQVGDCPVLMNLPVRFVLSVLGCLGGAALAGRLAAMTGGRALQVPFLVFGALQIPLIFVGFGPFDRYFLPIMPVALAIADFAPERSENRWLPGLAGLLVLAVISIGLMHDWLSWNQARWMLGQRALDKDWKPTEIEGGLEWNGWYSPEVRPHSFEGQHRMWLPFTAQVFPHVLGRVALSFSPIKGTRILDQEPYTLWLLARKQHFYLLEAAPMVPQSEAASISHEPARVRRLIPERAWRWV
jgi:hypothetical protein